MSPRPFPVTPPLGEVHIPRPDDDGWMLLENTGGLRVYYLYQNADTGASIALLDFPAGAGIPVRHTHASNQFMYCLEGRYEYLEPHSLLLEPGHFYMNPKGHPHGPTRALERALLLEIYDGPHYDEIPPYHTAQTVGKLSGGRP
ncbi:MAG: cupin domain-containing protein [Burkholderiaceae bacterium]|nr:cupin domain-containing protein [Burkholderiaceae bacterium]